MDNKIYSILVDSDVKSRSYKTLKIVRIPW